jgi:hypothetical protein
LRDGGTDGLPVTDEVGEDLEEVGVGHTGEQHPCDVVVEDRSGVVSPPPPDDLPIVLKDRHELHVAESEGNGVLRRFGERRRVGGLVEQQEERFNSPLRHFATVSDISRKRPSSTGF